MSYSLNNTIFISSGKIGIGTKNPQYSLDLSQKTDAIIVPYGSTNNRINRSNIFRFNIDTNDFEFNIENKWSNIPQVPLITGVFPLVLKNANETIDISGTNFSSNAFWYFIDKFGTVYNPKQVTYNSSTSVRLVRPDLLPVDNAPYTIKVKQYGRYNTFNFITAGVIPSLNIAGGNIATVECNLSITSIVITATDELGGGILSMSITSGSLPPGLSGNYSNNTYTISGTPNNVANTTITSFTLSVIDFGNNLISQNYSITVVPTIITSNNVVIDGDYKVVTFTSNTTITIPTTINVDMLLIGGGGAGGTSQDRTAGGGGAGGFKYLTNYTLVGDATYTIDIGVGGGTNYDPQGGMSYISYYGDYISVSGGGFGGNNYDPPSSGASGGGIWHGGGTPGSGITGEGYRGGSIAYDSGISNGTFAASGGGGAGGVGQNGTSSGGGNGGIGIQNSITGTPTYYAGGGGGSAQSMAGQNIPAGSGGLGGGGGGAKSSNNITDVTGGNATFYGGGGGAGGGAGGVGGTGYQGVLIIRYKYR